MIETSRNPHSPIYDLLLAETAARRLLDSIDELEGGAS